MKNGPCFPADSVELACLNALIGGCFAERRPKPMTAEELLSVCADAFEPLFHGPPIGPIPDYLAPHLFVHGCVAGYEEQYDELDRWKARELNHWLKARAGVRWTTGTGVFELVMQTGGEDGQEKFLFRSIEEEAPADRNG